MLRKILSFFFPNPCVVCGRAAGKDRFVCRRCEDTPIYIGRNSVCRTCFESIPTDVSYCPRCLLLKPKYDRLVACAKYSGKLRWSVYRFKFCNRPDFGESFALMMQKRLSEFNLSGFDCVVPVPMTKKQVMARGYNQSEILAQKLSCLINAECIPHALYKTRETKRQSLLKSDEREANVRGVFKLTDHRLISNKRILLVDDIVTTGATVREVSRVLSRYAKSVTVCTVSKTVLKR